MDEVDCIGELNLTINQYESLPARRAAVGTVRVAPVAVVKTCTLCFYWLSLCFIGRNLIISQIVMIIRSWRKQCPKYVNNLLVPTRYTLLVRISR